MLFAFSGFYVSTYNVNLDVNRTNLDIFEQDVLYFIRIKTKI